MTLEPLFCWASGMTLVRDRDASLTGFGLRKDFMKERHIYGTLKCGWELIGAGEKVLQAE